MNTLSLAFTVSTLLSSVSSLATATEPAQLDRAPRRQEDSYDVEPGSGFKGTADIAGRVGPVGAAVRAGLQ